MEDLGRKETARDQISPIYFSHLFETLQLVKDLFKVLNKL